MTAQEMPDYLRLIEPATPTVTSIVGILTQRLADADAREAAALLNLGRVEKWNQWLEEQAKVYERRIGGLVVQCDQLANARRLAERDRWIAVLVCVGVVLMMALLCAVVLVLR